MTRIAATITERLSFIDNARTQAAALHAQADTFAAYDSHERAHELRMEASELIDRAAQAQQSLGIDALLVI